MPADLFGDAAEEPVQQGRVSTVADDDEVGVQLLCGIDDFLRWVTQAYVAMASGVPISSSRTNR